MAGSDLRIHPTAVVHPGARVDPGAVVGPFCVIGPEAVVGPGTVLESHVTVGGRTTIGADNRVSPFVAIGGEPQDVGYKNEPSRIQIGDRNVIREFVTIHRATTKQDLETVIGDDNYLMAYSHVAHDCRLGRGIIMLHGATLGGHCQVGDFALVGAMSGVHQFCRLGRFSFMGGRSMVTQDVLPFCRVAGQRPTRALGLNVVGLRRNGFSRERIASLKAIFQILLFENLNTTQALDRIETEFPPSEDREEIAAFIRAAKRGYVKKSADAWDRE